MGAVTRDLEHSRLVQAPAERLYALVADVGRWPVVLGPCIRARQIELFGDTERIEISARTNDAVTSWTSRRTLDPANLRVTFGQERTTPPVAAMSGEWSFHPTDDGGTRIVLTHAFSADADKPEALDWIEQAIDRNSEAELAALGGVAELGVPLEQLVFEFSDRLVLPGISERAAYDFIYRSDLWPERLPHVRRVSTREEHEGVQEMEMDTVTSDGSAHTTTSVRLCSPHREIAYKQTVLPVLLSGHSGVWEFEAVDGGAAITSRHTVALNPAAVEKVLGPGTSLAQAGAHVRDTLRANSRATMEAAGRYGAPVVQRS
jgi:aromatase